MSGEIKQLVDAICHGDNDTLLREHAVAIAESQLWLSCIGWEKLAALERLRDPEEDALTGRNNRRGLAKIKAKVALRIRAYEIAGDHLIEVNALIDATTRAGRDSGARALAGAPRGRLAAGLLKGAQGPKGAR